MKTLTTQKSIVCSELKYVWVSTLKALFASNNKRKRSPFLTKKKRCSFGMYSFLTHGHFVSLGNSFLFLKMLFLEPRKSFSSLQNVREWATITCQTKSAIFCRWKRTTFPFIARNEQCFKNLHGVVENKEHFSNEKGFNVIAYLQSEILIILVLVSSGDLTFFFRETTKISGNMTQVSGDLTGYRLKMHSKKRVSIEV